MDVLILASAHDFHAYVVELALQRRGTSVGQWDLASFGAERRGTIFPSQGSFGLELNSGHLNLSDWPRTVWARRLSFPKPPETSHDGDRKHIRQENSFFFQSAWWLLAENSQWVNPYESRRRAKSKIVQLRVAADSGLSVPATLYSNDPSRIRTFSEAHPQGLIYKPHRISQFEEAAGDFLLHTTAFSAGNFSDEELALCAGIFQRRVPKAFELRVHVMGDFVLAARIDSQSSELGQEDWRDADFLELGIEPYVLPDAVMDSVKRTVRGLGLVFGIVDLIVTPGGEYVFLEVNEMGQFLWAERACPDLRLLEHFCNFLENPIGYSGSVQGMPTAYADITGDPEARERFTRMKTVSAAPDYEVEWIDVLV